MNMFCLVNMSFIHFQHNIRFIVFVGVDLENSGEVASGHARFMSADVLKTYLPCK